MWQTQRFERKFPLPEGRASHALALLRSAALPDPDHPYGVVNTVYLDTPGLESYFDALNGNFRKQKVRVRWYGEPSPGEEVTLFLEVKSKKGFASRKTRIERPTASRELEEETIGRMVAGLGTGTLLAKLGVRSSGWLRPVVQIRYQRHRFVDPISQAPVSLDHSIRSRLLDPTLAVSPGWLELRNAVIEVKGTATRLPPSLQALRRHMPVWTSYSKYAQCLAGHLERPGSVAWLKGL